MSYAYGQTAGDVAAQFSPVAQSTITQLLVNVPAAVQAPLAQRTVFPTATSLVVTDVYEATDGTCSDVEDYTVALTGGTPISVGHATSLVNADHSISGTASTSTQESNATWTSSPTNCDACGTSGLAETILSSTFCGIVSGGSIPLGVACGVMLYLGGQGNSGICSAENCSNPSLPGMTPSGYSCTFGNCTIDALVYDGTGGRTLLDLADTTIWFYPEFTAAVHSPGYLANEWTDTNTISDYWNYQVSTITNSQQYQWGQYGSDIAWTNCSSSAQISVTAQWTDYSFESSGFQSYTKPFLTSCPGYQVG